MWRLFFCFCFFVLFSSLYCNGETKTTGIKKNYKKNIYKMKEIEERKSNHLFFLKVEEANERTNKQRDFGLKY